MKKYVQLATLSLSLGVVAMLLSSCQPNVSAKAAEGPINSNFSDLAPTPPMGWNSFDAYDCRINEAEFKANVDVMASKLLPYGWDYAVLDYIWWHPEPGNWNTPRRKGHPNIRYTEDGAPLHPEYITMDEHGILQPSVDRFPSAANGQGLKPIADYVHSKGMKFGLHIMRGIHRKAAHDGSLISGTSFSAAGIAEPTDTCQWCNHMFGVDHEAPGAQEYYHAIFRQYAAWEVDYIKADDMIFPVYHEKELEMIRKAIDACGRPMVLSLSPGEAPLSRASHLIANANLWRISADFWDDWEKLRHNFDLLNAWSGHTKPGHWPDADMLPIGRLSLDDRPHGPERMSHFTWPEHYTLMTLWSIARSPLMMGGDLLSTPDSVMALLQNPEVIAVNQSSSDNHQVYLRDHKEAAWAAKDPATGDTYLALFNLSDQATKIDFELELEYLRATYKVRDLWNRQDISNATTNRLVVELPPHGAGLYRLTATDQNP
ncbi:MAG: glycoside hydrolase family 27 protein [Bacteroidia bacterium]|nr:glycoside hydrolase family 27 protein [Bacteroidia bacterium]